MVEIRQLKPRLVKYIELDNPDPTELFEIESYDGDDDQDDLSVENIENNPESSNENYTTEDCNDFIQNFTVLRKVQEALDQISYTLGNFLRDREHLFMERNIFSLNNRGIGVDAPDEDLPLDVRLAAYLLSQGDNRRVDDLITRLNQNVVVNVNLSYYFKLMLVMLTVNTLLLFKWIIWDHFPQIFP
nr:uncharacterized protein LOC111507645 [Leptinotarsa decemlineata]